MGWNGPIPLKGLPGPPGEAGEDGTDGQPGPQGLQGQPGVSGIPGMLGIGGEDGEDTLLIPGPVGQAGAIGPTGAPAIPDDGEDGMMGPPGQAGVKGATGMTGPPGLDGEDGEQAFNVPPTPSGAVAGLYGDSTHVAQVTVDYLGRVTKVASVAISGGGGINIGDAIGGSTISCVLFVDLSNKLGEDANFTWTSGQLSITGKITTSDGGRTSSITDGQYGARFTYSTYYANLVDSVTPAAAGFSDGTTQITICDGTFAIVANLGLIKTLGTSGNTFYWGQAVGAPSTQTLLTLPLNVYGAGTITDLLGDPDSWVLVNIAGTNYKIPAYL